MAVAALPQTASVLANSLSQEEIPVKLRCASCNRLVLEAFRLPCCDQNICEACRSSLPEACPVCAHSPISAGDCKPNKSLRLTVKAFLKSEEKKRERERAVTTASVPATPITPIGSGAAETISTKETSVESKEPRKDESATTGASEDDQRNENENFVDSIEQTTLIPQTEADAPAKGSKDALDEEANGKGPNSILSEQNNKPEEQDEGAGWSLQNNPNGGQMSGQIGFERQAAFQANDWPGGFNPMMMMQQQMQNAMTNGNWGFPNMMGMPGMGMNPMDMSQGMYGGFGMQGMNGMNGMMGNGMDFSSGYGWNNAQQMSSDFGHSGDFYPGGGGYNQSHQSHFQHQNHFARNNTQNQNRFHGQGPSERSGSGQDQGPSRQANDDQEKQNVAQSHASQELSTEDGSSLKQVISKDDAEGFDHSKTSTGESLANNNKSGDDSNAQADQEDQEDHGAEYPPQEGENTTNNAVVAEAISGQGPSNGNHGMEQDSSFNAQHDGYSDMQANGPNEQYIAGYDTDQNGYMQNSMMHGDFSQAQNLNFNNHPQDQSYQMGMGGYEFSYRGRGRGGFGRGGWRNRGGFQQQQTGDIKMLTPTQPIGTGVEGAPTGPRAMRERFTTRGTFRGRGGFVGRGGYHGSESSNPQTSTEQEEPNALNTLDNSKAASDREETDRRDIPLSRSKSRSRTPRSRSRSRSRRRQSRSRRSRSISSDRDSYEQEHKRRHHRSSRKANEEVQDIEDDTWRDSRDQNRSRDSSVESSTSRHKSHRREKDRHRSSRSHRESSRERKTHRHRSRTPDYMQMELEDGSTGRREAGHHSSDNTRRKTRSDRNHEPDRESGYDRTRDKERDYNREKHRGKDRDKDKDREKRRSRRDHSSEPDEDDHHRSSRRSRRGKDRDRERDYDRQTEGTHRSSRDKESGKHSARVNELSKDEEFQIQGRSKERHNNLFNPPTGPAAASRQPPTGPKALLAKISTMSPPTAPASSRRSHPPTPISAEMTPASTTPTDVHTMEREARNRERMLKEQQRRQQLHGGASGNQLEERKRSYNELDDEQEKPFMPPTGPRGDQGRRKKSRRMNYKYEDEENDEARARRVESEREASRWH